MDADHSNICKFSDPKGDDYFPVWTNIWKMSKLAVEKSKISDSLTLPEKNRGLVSSRSISSVEEKSYYILPALSVSCFIKRPALMKQLEEYSMRTDNSPYPIVVLLGMGGQGKSQLIMDYCRASKASRKYQAIFWVDVTSENSLARSFEDITAKICDQAPFFSSTSSRITFIKDFIENWNFPWLLVFDNYDCPNEITRISDCFPQSEFGTIIITSRHSHSTRLGKVIKITGMEEEESMDLLFFRSQLARTDENVSEAKSIVEKLGYLPLAVDQAGSYISAQNLSMSLFAKQYEERKAYILKFTPSLTEYRKKLNDSDAETALNVFTTLELSLEAVDGSAETRRLIEDFLTLSAFFNKTMIGEDLARRAVTEFQPEWMRLFTSEGVWDHYKFQDIMANLHHISLLQSLSPGEILYFSLHPLVVDWLKLRRDKPSCRNCTILSGSIVRRFLHVEDLKAMQLGPRQYFLAHIDECLRNQRLYLSNLDLMDEEVVETMSSFGKCLLENNCENEAMEILQTVLHNSNQIYGAKHKNTLAAVHNLAIVFRYQGKLNKAEELYQQALCCYEKVPGKGSISALNTVNSLGLLYQDQGKLKEAEEMYQRALRGYEVLVQDHGSTFGAANNLGNIYLEQGKLKEAEEMLQRALRGYEVLGQESTSKLNVVYNLGRLYARQVKFKEAEEMFQQALRGFEKSYGLDHWKTLETCKSLGLVCAEQGKVEEAEELLYRAVRGYNKLFGADHESTLGASRNLQWAQSLESSEKERDLT